MTNEHRLTLEVVSVGMDGVALQGQLALPAGAAGVVLFVHGSGSSRHSPRNMHVAGELNARGIATLLIDLLTPAEDAVYETRFDIPLLVRRCQGALRWLARDERTGRLPVGLFGASTGAAAALQVAAAGDPAVATVVSRGGRPDLVRRFFATMHTPTLFIVGARDTAVLEWNREAYAALQCERALHIVDGATHLFEESGALEEVAHVAADWFARHFVAVAEPAHP